MSANIAQDINSLCARYLPHLPAPRLAILGGSQTFQNGSLATTNSDYDALVFFDDIPEAQSLCVMSPDGYRKYDLIIRDRAAYAHDINISLQRGRGTLLHILAMGVPVIDKDDKAVLYQNAARQILETGPYLPHPESVKANIQNFRHTLDELSCMEGDTFRLSVLSLVNEMGKEALSLSGQWTSTGKILGRFLQEHLPSFKDKLEDAYATVINHGTISPFYGLLDEDMPEYYKAAQKLSRPIAEPTSLYRPQKAADQITLPNAGDATTAIRCNPNYLASCHRSVNPLAVQLAATWHHYKLDLVGHAVNPERIGRSSNEYFFSIARVVSTLADTTAIMKTSKPDELSHNERHSLLAKTRPYLAEAVTSALAGSPHHLHQEIAAFHQMVPTAPLEAYRRVSSASFVHPGLPLPF